VKGQQAELKRLIQEFGFELPDVQLRQRVQEALDAKPVYRPVSERVPTFSERISTVFAPDGQYRRL